MSKLDTVVYSSPSKNGDYYSSNCVSLPVYFKLHTHTVPFLQLKDGYLLIPLNKLSPLTQDNLNSFLHGSLQFLTKHSQDWFNGRKVSYRMLRDISMYSQFNEGNKTYLSIQIPEIVNDSSADKDEHESTWTKKEVLVHLNDDTIQDVCFKISEIKFYQHSAIFQCTLSHISFDTYKSTPSKPLFVDTTNCDVDEEHVPLPIADEIQLLNSQQQLKIKTKKEQLLKLQVLQEEYENHKRRVSDELNKVTDELQQLELNL